MSRTAVSHIYIHVPFCVRKCGYCSFYSRPVSPQAKQRYLDALQREIELYARDFDLRPRTIYFGGGTPSLLQADEISTILTLLDLRDATEITIEANPATINAAWCAALAQTPVNRVSVGAQSFDDNELRWLGRLHSAAAIDKSFALLRAHGFANLSLDLIYGLPGQRPASLEASLAGVARLAPEHVSLYCLSLDDEAPLYPQRDRLPDDDTVADLYDHLCDRLPQLGYKAYEISNFTRGDHASRHNLAYWSGAFYLGLGPAAAGNLPELRYANPADLDAWLAGVQRGMTVPNAETISREERMREAMVIGLRRTAGVDLAAFASQFGVTVSSLWGEEIARLEELGYIEQTGGMLRLTRPAWFVSNEVLQSFC